jgi:pimeloyl-ACP methyl ester carboxylesterase
MLAWTEQGAGDPVLLLHGFPCTRLLWQPVMELLSRVGFHCVAPDLLGYGNSPSAADVSMAAQVPQLLALLDELRLDSVDLVAHDVGTAAAQLFALQHRSRVRRVFLMDGVYETEWAMGAIDSIRTWDEQRASRLQPVLARRLAPIHSLLATYVGHEGGMRLIHAARCLDPFQTQGATARLCELCLPITVAWGTQDEFLPLSTVGRPLAAALGVDVVALEGGHFLPLDNPVGVASVIGSPGSPAPTTRGARHPAGQRLARRR